MHFYDLYHCVNACVVRLLLWVQSLCGWWTQIAHLPVCVFSLVLKKMSHLLSVLSWISTLPSFFYSCPCVLCVEDSSSVTILFLYIFFITSGSSPLWLMNADCPLISLSNVAFFAEYVWHQDGDFVSLSLFNVRNIELPLGRLVSLWSFDSQCREVNRILWWRILPSVVETAFSSFYGSGFGRWTQIAQPCWTTDDFNATSK